MILSSQHIGPAILDFPISLKLKKSSKIGSEVIKINSKMLRWHKNVKIMSKTEKSSTKNSYNQNFEKRFYQSMVAMETSKYLKTGTGTIIRPPFPFLPR